MPDEIQNSAPQKTVLPEAETAAEAPKAVLPENPAPKVVLPEAPAPKATVLPEAPNSAATTLPNAPAAATKKVSFELPKAAPKASFTPRPTMSATKNTVKVAAQSDDKPSTLAVALDFVAAAVAVAFAVMIFLHR